MGDDEQKQQSFEPPAFVDELGVEDICDPIFGARGRLFSAAGRFSPVIEFTEDFVVAHPPQKPFQEGGPVEDIVININDQGILLDELMNPKKIAGARFRGNELYWLGERRPGTLKHYAGWFDEKGDVHKVFLQNEPLTTDIIFRLRNRTHDGELGIFPDLVTD